MARPGDTGRVGPSGPDGAAGRRDRAAELYERYGARLYRQVLLALGDARLAEQVVTDVVVEACQRPGAVPGDAPDTRSRLSVSAYRRCRDLPGAPERRSRRTGPWPSGQRPSGQAARGGDPGGLARRERDALGLVLFGGLGYAQAGRELAIPAREMATLLHDVLSRLAGPPASGELRGWIGASGGRAGSAE